MQKKTTATWRESAARIVEELFANSASSDWDALLELRGRLLRGAECEEVLDAFFCCRQAMEHRQYLPFFRLRRLLAASLRLEAGVAGVELPSLEKMMRTRLGSSAALKRRAGCESFEYGASASPFVGVRVVEAAS